jgi:hypothetical protein
MPNFHVSGMACGYAAASWAQFEASDYPLYDTPGHATFTAEGASWRYRWSCSVTGGGRGERWSCTAPAGHAGGGVLAHRTHHGRVRMSFTVKTGWPLGVRCADTTTANGTEASRPFMSPNFSCDSAHELIDDYYDGQSGYYDEQGDLHPMKCIADPPEDGYRTIWCHKHNVTPDGDDGAQMYKSYVSWTELPRCTLNPSVVDLPACKSR